MLDQFLDFVARNQLCNKLDSTLLAVSGGIDSTVMFYLFRQAGFRMGVAHANFQLRGAESEGDQAFVTQLCTSFEVPLFVRRFETEKYAWEKSLSVQLAARELRYAWFRELIAQQGYTHLATAHHFDDTMETVLLNLTRGTGIDGLAGIPIRNGPIIRPMMFASRRQVEKYAEVHGIVWREDASNQTDNYQRNYIRHHVLPHLRELNPSLDITWRSGLQKVNHEMAILQDALDQWKKKFVREEKGKICIAKEGVDDEGRANPAILWRFIRNFGFNFEQAIDIQGCVSGRSGKRFYSSSHLLVVDRAQLVIADRSQEWRDVYLESLDDLYHLGQWTLSMAAVPDHDLSSLRQKIAEGQIKKNSDQKGIELPDHRSPANDGQVWVDASKLTFPLTWRKWKPGDYFYPLGLGHRKKLSDLFIDTKLSVADKEGVTIIESNGEIVWVVGHRIDDRFKITVATTECITFKITHLG